MTMVAASAEPLRSSATLLVIVMRPVPAPVESASAETSSQTLPKTASSFPLMVSAELGSIYLPWDSGSIERCVLEGSFFLL